MARESQKETFPSLSRRQLAQLAGSSAAGLLLGGAACSTEPPRPTEKPMPSVATPADDPRIAHIEKRRGIPLTEEQRKGLPAQLKDLDNLCTKIRQFALEDGGSEPGTIFHPVPPGSPNPAPREIALG